MEAKRFQILFTFLFLTNFFCTSAQESTTPHFDPSKPTNVYNRLSNNLEYNFLKNGSRTFGYRANFVLVSHNQRNSVHIEIPLLYSTFSQRFGLSDIRFRYYWIPYKDYSKKPGAFGFLVDSYMPVGSLKYGLGRGRWIFAPGLSTAFVFGRFSTFPILSYLYMIKPNKMQIGCFARRYFHGNSTTLRAALRLYF